MNPFEHSKYFSKKKFLKILGGQIRIFDESRANLLFFVKQKALRLKEDIQVFGDEGMQQPLLRIAARSVLDISATYDITDVRDGQKVGALRRKGIASAFLMDQWEILDGQDRPIGLIREDSMLMALVRRYLTNIIPQKYHVFSGTTADAAAIVGVLKQTFNPFIAQFNVDFSMDGQRRLDRRLGIAAVILLQIIEGRQQ